MREVGRSVRRPNRLPALGEGLIDVAVIADGPSTVPSGRREATQDLGVVQLAPGAFVPLDDQGVPPGFRGHVSVRDDGDAVLQLHDFVYARHGECRSGVEGAHRAPEDGAAGD